MMMRTLPAILALCLAGTAFGTTATNLIVNGDFATGDLSGWLATPNAPTTITQDASEGLPAGSALLDRNSVGEVSNGNHLYQVIPVTPGQQYRLDAVWKGDLYAGGTGRNWAEVFVSFASSPTATPTEIVYKKASDGGPNQPPASGWDWESVLLSPNDAAAPADGVFTATDNYMVVGFNLGGRASSDGPGPGFFHLDNVSVTSWPPEAKPRFTDLSFSGDDIVLEGVDGPPGGAFRMLASADLAQPAGDWLELGIDAFDPAGGFLFTAPRPADPAAFFQLEVLSDSSTPVIGEQPQELVVAAGGSASFSVTASGLEPLQYQWYHDGDPVPGATSASLVLDEVDGDDSGEYFVRISNALGEVDSETVVLEVVTDPAVPVADGYATQNGGTTGGGNATPQVVSTAEAFRSAVENDDPAVIIVDGRLDVGDVDIGSNKTILGADEEAGLYGGTLRVRGSNDIFQNLSLGPSGNGGDVMEISGAENVYVTRCEFHDSDDELCSIVRGADWVTVSWSKFYFDDPDSHSYAHLIGNGDDVTSDRGKLHVTLHHNWYSSGVRGRMPRVRFGHVHIYNCYYNSPGNGYCVGVGKECHIRLEGSHFDNVNDPWEDYGGSSDGEIGWADLIFDGSTQPTFMPNSFPVFDPPYAFTPDRAVEVEALVRAGAGNVAP